ATGVVVDDAIVVLENATRHIEAGMPPVAAALASAQEVGFTVVSMSLSLIAVFIPILFMGDIVGRLFREFALTLSAAILLSLVVSLTLTPMMCARLLKQQEKSVLHRRSELIFETVRGAYGRSLGWALRHPLLIVALRAAAIGLNVYLYIAIPKGFFPEQDTGRMMGFIRADQTTSFQAMQEKMSQMVQLVRADPAVDTVTAVTGGGFGARNSGFMFIALKPLSQRPSVGAVIARLRPQLARVPGANLFLVPVQDVRIGGRQGTGTYQYTLQSDDLEALRLWTMRLQAALQSVPQLGRGERPGNAWAAGDAGHRRGQRRAPRRHARSHRYHARQRLRAGHRIDDLHREKPVPRGDGSGPAFCAGTRSAEGRVRHHAGRRAGAARRGRPLRIHAYAALGE